MKKTISLLLVIVLLSSILVNFSSCNNQRNVQTKESEETTQETAEAQKDIQPDSGTDKTYENLMLNVKPNGVQEKMVDKTFISNTADFSSQHALVNKKRNT